MASTNRKVAVVTGSNKGIGYAIVKGLCENFDGDVYLTARDVGRGEAAVKKLKEAGFSPLFHQLDITDQSSVDNFKNYIKTKHGGLDILINNAGVAFKNDDTVPFHVQAEEIIGMNYYGTLRVCEALFPLLRNNAKVVNVSSSFGFLGRIPSEDLRTQFGDRTLTVSSLNQLLDKYIKDAQDGKRVDEGLGRSAYAISKVGVTALSLIQQREFDNESPNRNIAVNSVHPGYVNTDMTDHKGRLTSAEGAKAPLWLALEAADVKGQYVWYDCQIVDWFGSSTPTIS